MTNQKSDNLATLYALDSLLMAHADKDVEASVLANAIHNQDLQMKAALKLRSNMFYYDNHRLIFEAMMKLFRSGESFDLLTLINYLRKLSLLDKAGGVAYLSSFYRLTGGEVQFEQHCFLLVKLSTERQFILSLNESLEKLKNGDDVLETMEQTIASTNEILLSVSNEDANIKSMSQALEELEQTVKENRDCNKKLSGIPTGFYWLDNRTGGFQNGNLITIAAESSQGKTSLALSITRNALLKGYCGAYYSLEMGAKELSARLVAMDSAYTSNTLTSSNILYKTLNNEEYSAFQYHKDELKEGKLYFDERVNAKAENIIRSVKILKAKYKIQFAVVDYLQIMSVNSSVNTTNELQLAEISRQMKNLALSENIPIIILSQLARDRQNHEPNNARLRGSGQIEEASDIVLLIYRPEVYGQGFSGDLQGEDPKGKALLKITKGRNTGIFQFLAGFIAEKTLFYDLPKNDTSNT